MQETQNFRVPSLGWEDPLEKEMATQSSILARKFRGQRSLADYSPWDLKELDITECVVRTHAHTHLVNLLTGYAGKGKGQNQR